MLLNNNVDMRENSDSAQIPNFNNGCIGKYNIRKKNFSILKN